MSVVIAGAGPTGLVLACALLRRGLRVQIVDSAAGPSTTSRAFALQPRGQEVLDRLGALSDLRERGITATTVSLYSGTRPLLSLKLSGHDAGDRSMVLISQAEIETQLRRRLGELGGRVQWGTPVVDATADKGGVTVTVGEDRQITRADWLVGCDGAHSAVRKLAGIEFPGTQLIERFLLADVYADLPLSREGTAVWLHRHGMFAALPLQGKLWRLMADVPGDDGDVMAQLRHLSSVRTSMTGARIGEAVWTSVFRIQRRIAAQYRRGRILLAGDAAHINSPFGGQGLNTGIGDAENLAWKLVLVAKGIADEQLLDTYDAERRPVAREIVAGTTVATRALLGGSVATNWIRDRLVLPATNLPIVQSRLLIAAGQLSVSYRGGPLAPKFQFPTGLRVGDRVADMACRRHDGIATRLHQELAGRWALLAGNRDALPVIDRLGEEVSVLTAPVSDPLLIRPDGHLAWQKRQARIPLSTWLDRILG